MLAMQKGGEEPPEPPSADGGDGEPADLPQVVPTLGNLGVLCD